MKLSLKTILLLCLVLFISLAESNGQVEDLKANKDISFLSSLTIDYTFNPEQDDIDNYKYKKLLFDSGENYYRLEKWLLTQIIDRSLAGAYNCYEDRSFDRALNIASLEEKMMRVDTVKRYNYETYEPYFALDTTRIPIGQISGLRCEQLLSYNKKKKEISSQLVAVAPLWKRTSGSTPVELFWISMPTDLPDDFDVNNTNIVWSVLSNNISSTIKSDISDDHLMKGTYDSFKEDIFKIAKNKKTYVERRFGTGEPIPDEKLTTVIDTVVTFQPETFEENIQVVKSELDPAKYRLVQEWYFDKETGKLYVDLVAIAPVNVILNKNGEFVFEYTAYFVRTN